MRSICCQDEFHPLERMSLAVPDAVNCMRFMPPFDGRRRVAQRGLGYGESGLETDQHGIFVKQPRIMLESLDRNGVTRIVGLLTPGSAGCRRGRVLRADQVGRGRDAMCSMSIQDVRRRRRATAVE